MKVSDFKRFCLDISLGIFLTIIIIFLLNLSRIFDYHEKSTIPEMMWRNFTQEKIINTPDILFTGNSQTYYLNPKILDSTTQKSSMFYGYPGAGIEILSWFFLNPWENINLDLVVLETHAFKKIGNVSRLDSIRQIRWENDFPRFKSSRFSLPYIQWKKFNLFRDFNFISGDDLKLPHLIAGALIENHHIFETKPNIPYRALFRSKKDSLLNNFRISKRLPITDSLQKHYNSGLIPVLDKPIDQKTLQTVKQIVTLCQERGVKVLLYESPMYYKHAEYQKKRYEQLDSISTLLNIPFVNLNKDTSLTRKSYFFENTLKPNQHLTSSGADEVSKALANKILELNLLEEQ